MTTCWVISGGFDETSREAAASMRLVSCWCSTNPLPSMLSKGFAVALKYLDSPGEELQKDELQREDDGNIFESEEPETFVGLAVTSGLWNVSAGAIKCGMNPRVSTELKKAK